MNDGYAAEDWSVYVGWTNPIVSGNFDSALIGNIDDVMSINSTEAEYVLSVKDWPGLRSEIDGNGLYQFYLTSRITYKKE